MSRVKKSARPGQGASSPSPDDDLPQDFALRFEVSPAVSNGALAECIGLLVESPVQGLRVATSTLAFQVAAEEPDHHCPMQIHIHRATSGWVPPALAMTQIFRLWQGLRSSGFTVTTDGNWCEHFKEHQERPAGDAKPCVPWMREQRLGEGEQSAKRVQVDIDAVNGLHQALSTMLPFSEWQRSPEFLREFPEHRAINGEVWEILLSHRSGLEVLVLLSQGLIKCHRILGHAIPWSVAQRKALDSRLKSVAGENGSVDGAMTRLPFGRLASSLPRKYAPFLEELGSEFSAVDMDSDFGRYPRRRPEIPSMTLPGGEVCGEAAGVRLTLSLLLAAGLGAATLQAMRVEAGTDLNAAEPFADWFAIDCGPHHLWGDNRGRVLVCGDLPGTLYEF